MTPDVYLLGKALGAGVYPVSAVAADEAVLGVFEPGSHGSTFGGNPLAAAVAVRALEVILEEGMVEKSLTMGKKFMDRMQGIFNPHITEVRGRGLFIGVVLDCDARPYCERMKEAGVLAKETHVNVIRFAPPLIIGDDELNWACERIERVLTA